MQKKILRKDFSSKSIFSKNKKGNIDFEKIFKNKKTKKQKSFSLFIKNFVFVLLLSCFIFISTIGLHEFGHVVAARYYDCEYRTILFEEDSYPYTEIFCPDGEFRRIIIWAGPLLPSLFAILLFIVGGKFVREIALMMFGFNLITAYKDFMDLGFSPYLRMGSILFGAFIITLGLITLNHERFKLGLMVNLEDSLKT